MKTFLKHVIAFILTIAAMVALSWWAASLVGCAPPKPKTYNGYDVPPYVEHDKIDHMVVNCGAVMCRVDVYVEPVIHNPLFARLDGELVCTFGAHGQKYEFRKHVKMGPRTSLRVEVTKSVQVPIAPPTQVEVECYYRYAKRRV